MDPSLPADHASIIEALIVGGDADWLCLVLTPYYLEVARASIAEIEELPVPDTVRGERAVAVRLTLQPNAVIRSLRSSQGLEREIRRRRSSFPVASRPAAPSTTGKAPELVARSRAFFARYDLPFDEESP